MGMYATVYGTEVKLSRELAEAACMVRQVDYLDSVETFTKDELIRVCAFAHPRNYEFSTNQVLLYSKLSLLTRWIMHSEETTLTFA